MPKCLLRVGNRTLLDRQLESLTSNGVGEIAIVVGYRAEEIVRHVRREHPDIRISFIENSSYADTNNSFSLLLAERWVGKSKFICLNADVLYHPMILPPAIGTAAPISMIVDPEFREETMKVIIRDGRVVEMRKGIPREKFSGTYIGITTFSARICPLLFARISELVAAGGQREFFNTAVQRLANQGIEVSYTLTGGLPWAEIDDPNDYRFALEVVVPQLADTTRKASADHEFRGVAM
jgi:choline kinase